jgi:hypothetical protein
MESMLLPASLRPNLNEVRNHPWLKKADLSNSIYKSLSDDLLEQSFSIVKTSKTPHKTKIKPPTGGEDWLNTVSNVCSFL